MTVKFAWAVALFIAFSGVLMPRYKAVQQIFFILLSVLIFQAQAQTASSAAAPARTIIQTQAVSELALYPWREASASVVARNQAKISSEISGVIVKIAAEAGQSVGRGAELVQIDPTDYRLNLERARANLESSRARLAQAESQLRRARELQAQNFISPEAVTQRETEKAVIEAELKVSENALVQAQRALSKTNLRAPFAAVVLSREASVGEWANPGTPLLTLVEAAPAQVSAALSAADVASFDTAREWSLESQGRTWTLKKIRLAAAVNPGTRTREARLAFATGEAALPGTEGRLLWRDARIHLPASVVATRGVGADLRYGVVVVEQGKARFVPLAGVQEGRPVLLPQELYGAVIVARGQNAVDEGAALR
jgi:RND family efflux transporter MFP subunit